MAGEPQHLTPGPVTFTFAEAMAILDQLEFATERLADMAESPFTRDVDLAIDTVARAFLARLTGDDDGLWPFPQE